MKKPNVISKTVLNAQNPTFVASAKKVSKVKTVLQRFPWSQAVTVKLKTVQKAVQRTLRLVMNVMKAILVKSASLTRIFWTNVKFVCSQTEFLHRAQIMT